MMNVYPARSWSDQELAMLKDPQYTNIALAKKLHRTPAAVATKRYVLKKQGVDVARVSPSLWRSKLNDAQFEELLNPNQSITALAKKWGIPKQTLYTARYKYHLRNKQNTMRHMYRKWTKDEDDVLRDLSLRRRGELGYRN